MKKLIPLMVGLALTFGAVSMYGRPDDKATKSTKKTPKKKSTVEKK